jgi:hypothetical protein
LGKHKNHAAGDGLIGGGVCDGRSEAPQMSTRLGRGFAKLIGMTTTPRYAKTADLEEMGETERQRTTESPARPPRVS